LGLIIPHVLCAKRVTASSDRKAKRTNPPVDQESAKPRIWGFWMTVAWGIPLTLTAVLFQTIGAVAYLGVWRYLHPDRPIPLASAASNGAVIAFSLAVSAPVVILLLVAVVRRTNVPIAEYLGLKWPSWRELGLGIVTLGAVFALAGVAASLLSKESPAFISDTFTTARDAGMLPLLLLSFVILGPLQEELVFRGFFLHSFIPAIGVWPAILLTSAVWAVSHGQYEWFYVGEIFGLGLLFGWLRWRTGSTILTFILHAAVNAMAVVAAASGAV
jgi:membrane protease YdiL (CAAX protease family)